jgi:hypothetical protein
MENQGDLPRVRVRTACSHGTCVPALFAALGIHYPVSASWIASAREDFAERSRVRFLPGDCGIEIATSLTERFL